MLKHSVVLSGGTQRLALPPYIPEQENKNIQYFNIPNGNQTHKLLISLTVAHPYATGPQRPLMYLNVK